MFTSEHTLHAQLPGAGELHSLHTFESCLFSKEQESQFQGAAAADRVLVAVAGFVGVVGAAAVSCWFRADGNLQIRLHVHLALKGKGR